jgi:hypothetical protein
MSERLPYEEMDRQFNDLPLPDEEASWQKMKELLDDDDDDIIPPPVFLRSCLGWGILLLIGLIVAWLVIRPEKRGSENDKTKNISSVKLKEKNIDKTNSVEKKNITTIPAKKQVSKKLLHFQNKKKPTVLLNPR